MSWNKLFTELEQNLDLKSLLYYNYIRWNINVYDYHDNKRYLAGDDLNYSPYVASTLLEELLVIESALYVWKIEAVGKSHDRVRYIIHMYFLKSYHPWIGAIKLRNRFMKLYSLSACGLVQGYTRRV